jgi:hypothetical protein
VVPDRQGTATEAHAIASRHEHKRRVLDSWTCSANAWSPPTSRAHNRRSRAPCEYAERARTRAQIICARTSGPSRRGAEHRAAPLRSSDAPPATTDRPIWSDRAC